MQIEIKQLSKKFDKKTILENIDFTFEKGKIYVLLGRNGVGKTTLFNCINNDIKPDTGEILIHNNDQTRKLTTNDIGYVLSTPVVPEFLTANEFLKYYLDINKNEIDDMKSMDEYFDLVMLKEEDRNKLLKDFSHGMKNKMQMLVNIISKPKLLLLDEPLTSFDVVVAEEMKDLLRSIKKDCVIIFSTHILDIALDLCDEIVLLNNCKLSQISQDVVKDVNAKQTIIDILRGE